MKAERLAWYNEERKEWLNYNETTTHTGTKRHVSLVPHLEQASLLSYIPTGVRKELNLIPVKVMVEEYRKVQLKENSDIGEINDCLVKSAYSREEYVDISKELMLCANQENNDGHEHYLMIEALAYIQTLRAKIKIMEKYNEN